MLNLADRLQAANAFLAPYAVPHGTGLGRKEREIEDELRFPFQRDRGRIVHTQAFRRLQGKTQVFVVGESDHVRTRLTHTMEVAQISRDVARALQLNEDLAECIALAHDLGHPPFGHLGEQALNSWMENQDGHFEHNEQSLRIVQVLATHTGARTGLNLNEEVLEGLQKHSARPNTERSASIEAQVVDLCDEIAYSGHDCDDGLQAGLFTLEEAKASSLILSALATTAARGTSLRGGIIHLLVSDLCASADAFLQQNGLSTLTDVYQCTTRLDFSVTMRSQIQELRQLLQARMYEHPRVREKGKRGQEVIVDLCTAYQRKPPAKVLELQRATESTLSMAIADYVSGMTDTYAQHQVQGVRRMRVS
jgi:dGTPase